MDITSILSVLTTIIYFLGNTVSLLALLHFRRWGWITLLATESIYTLFQFVHWVILLDIPLGMYLSTFAVRLVMVPISLYSWWQWGRYPQPNISFWDTKIFQRDDTNILDSTSTWFNPVAHSVFVTSILKQKLFLFIAPIIACCYILIAWVIFDNNWIESLMSSLYFIGFIMIGLRTFQGWIVCLGVHCYYLYNQVSYYSSSPEYIDTNTYIYVFLNLLLLLITIYTSIYWYNYYKKQGRAQ